jgi:hypothetical protein
MISERVIEGVIELPNAAAFRNRAKRDDLDPRSPGSFKGCNFILR